jgi:soluble lytic murein transglycosylase-like protein
MSFVSLLVLAFPTSTGLGFSDFRPSEMATKSVNQSGSAIEDVDALLGRYEVKETHRVRISEAIVGSSRRHNVDPLLVASIVIIESRANPFAISPSDSVGVMQIHLPTWGPTVDKEGLNLFKIEDNVDFGVRILKNYMTRYGLWNGVKRYNGWRAGEESEKNAEEYVRKVQAIYSRERA